MLRPLLIFATLSFFGLSAFGDTRPIGIPERYSELIKSTDFVEVSGLDEQGRPEDFSIHNSKAIAQFVQLLISDRYVAVPKNLQPHFKSVSSYKIRLSAKSAPILQFQIIADSIVDLPTEPMFYMESDQYSDRLMAPLLRLR